MVTVKGGVRPPLLVTTIVAGPRVTGPEHAHRCFTNVYLTTLDALHDAEKVARHTLEQWSVPCKSKIDWA